MPRRPDTKPTAPDVAAGPAEAAALPSLADLGIAGISRRRLAIVALAILAAWVVVGFAGQAAEAADASARVAREQAATTEAAAATAALHRELQLVTQERWILQQARAYQLGSRRERPFALAPGTPPLADDAPGSAVRRVGAEVEERSPLDAWLEVLFGPAG
jgi:hypothetical protein